MPYASNNNAILISGCNNLANLSYILQVTEDIATTAGTGWSLQLNAYAPPGTYCGSTEVNVFQYMVVVNKGVIAYYIQYWAFNGAVSTLPCWPHDFGIETPFATGLNADTLPRGSTLQVALGTNADGGIATATFTYTDPNGNKQSRVWTAPAVHPICAFQLNFVGPPGGNATFTQGITSSRGIIYYSISSGQLSVQSGGPGSACGEVNAQTGEQSNMSYSDIVGAPASTVTQTLQQPITCALDNLFAGDQAAPVTQMTQLRDLQIARYPAGQWIIELLNRHSADLAVTLMSDQTGWAQNARNLLTQAAQISGAGGVFNDAIVDQALTLLGQVSGKLPGTMQGTASAGATVLNSLRGKTLQDGLQAASQTIRPRNTGKAT